MNVSADKNFHEIGSLEASCVLQRGLIYRRKSDNKVFLSLGFVQYTALGWQLDSVLDGDTTYFRFPNGLDLDLDQKIDHLQFLCNCGYSKNEDDATTEAFAGIPFEVCCLTSLTNVDLCIVCPMCTALICCVVSMCSNR